MLDLGCGLGSDAFEMAKLVEPEGTVIGVDSSEFLLEQADARKKGLSGSVSFVLGDALNLDFEDESFDRCRIDRTLQHLSSPELALSEMNRVLKPGGILIAYDNDWETFTINSSNHRLARIIANYWCDSFPSGWVGRYLFGYLKDLDLEDVRVFPRTLVVDDLDTADRVFDLFQTINYAEKSNLITSTDKIRFMQELRNQDDDGTLFCSYTGFIVMGRKPD